MYKENYAFVSTLSDSLLNVWEIVCYVNSKHSVDLLTDIEINITSSSLHALIKPQFTLFFLCSVDAGFHNWCG